MILFYKRNVLGERRNYDEAIKRDPQNSEILQVRSASALFT